MKTSQYLSKTFRGSICENSILTNSKKESLEYYRNAPQGAVIYWENEVKKNPNNEFAKEQVLFFTDALNLVIYKLNKIAKGAA